MKKKFLKVILLVILVIILFLCIHTVRNVIIIKGITNKIELYQEKTNFYVKSISNQGNTIENFYKDGCQLMKFINTSETGIRKMTRYDDGNIVNTYIETQTESGTEKIAMLNSNSLPGFQGITNWLYVDDTKHLILMALLANIRSVEQNEKECYKVDLLYASNILMQREENFVLFIEKETGLTIRNQNGAMVEENGNTIPIIMDYEYKFDVVTDENLAEPDVSEYKVQK